ncbi:MAG: hypothetical protein IPG87_19860 [Saprospiraceae bacterium]|nr:hypothetical protein [Candidatus Vicinibacter affinis]
MTTNKDVSFENGNLLKYRQIQLNEIIQLKFDKVYSGLLNIYYEIGQLIYSTKLKNDKEVNYDASGLINGYYSVQFITNNKILKSNSLKLIDVKTSIFKNQ